MTKWTVYRYVLGLTGLYEWQRWGDVWADDMHDAERIAKEGWGDGVYRVTERT